MNTISTKTYSDKSTAIRGARRAGLADDAFAVEKNEEGRWVVLLIPSKVDQEEGLEILTKTEEEKKEEAEALEIAEASGTDLPTVEESTEENNGVAADADDATEAPIKDVAPVAAPAVKGPSYKELPRLDRSAILKPVEYIWKFLDANPDMKRKDAVTHFVTNGINYSTARTQYQHWFKKNKRAS
jgi:hypothetical protein